MRLEKVFKILILIFLCATVKGFKNNWRNERKLNFFNNTNAEKSSDRIPNVRKTSPNQDIDE